MKHVLLPSLQLVLCVCIAAYGRPPDSEKAGIPIHGKVVSFLDKQPLTGVTVVIKGTRKGVITDVKGAFSLEAEANDTLIFSYVGYETLEVPIRGQASLYIELTEGIEMLQEIAVFSTGYEEIPAERATGSFVQVDNDLFNRSVSADAVSRLKGITPALLFDSRNGEDKLSIRGRSTIFANAQPLIVVDNFPYDGDINNLNPNDIENITILKDAAAASIWGVRAGNGVIVITTKRGRKNQPLQVNLNANVTIGKRPDLFYEPRMSTGDFIGVERFLFEQGYYDAHLNNTVNPPALSPVVEILASERAGMITAEEANAQIDALRTHDVRHDLEEHFYRQSVSQQYALNLNGGSEKHSWYLSGGFDKNLFKRAGNDYNRFNLSVQQTFEPVKNLEFSTGLLYTQSRTQYNSTLTRLLTGQGIYPYTEFTDAEGNPIPVTKDYRRAFAETAPERGLLNWNFVPIDELDLTGNTTKLGDMRATTGLLYHFFGGLNAEVKYQYEKQLWENHTLYDQDAYFTRDLVNRYSTVSGENIIRNIPLGSILDKSSTALSSNNLRAQLNYIHEWERHDLALLGGIDVREVKADGYRNRYYGYDSKTGLSQAVNYLTYYQQYPSGTWGLIPDIDNITGTVDRFRSYFANAAYTYGGRYTVSLSGRIDQSNLFGVKTNQRSVPLWSAGGKWNISEESFYAAEWLPVLQLRSTYGYSGNLDQSVTAYTTIRYYNDAITKKHSADIVSPPNPELRWEKTGMWNVGIDFAMKYNLLSGSIEYYRKQGTDLIGEAPLDPTTGLSGFRGNVADMTGKGVDVVLSSTIIDKAFRWQSNFLFSYTSDKVTNYKREPSTVSAYFQDASLTGYSFDLTPTEGKPLFGMYSYPWAGLDPQTGDPLGYLEGEPSNNYAGIFSAATFDSLVYHGPVLPPVFGSWRNSFSWKNFTLSVNITYKLGHYFRRPSINYSSLYSTSYGHSDYALRWQEPGDEAHTNVPSMVYPASSSRDTFYQYSEVLVEKADHVRLQDVQLGYDFSGSRLPFRHMQVYVYASNLGILWRARLTGPSGRANDQNLDPDYNVNRAVQTGSIVFPQPFALSVGFKAGF